MSALALLLLVGAAPAESLVDVQTRIPDAVVDLRYATADNFMKKAVYPSDARCLLLARSAEKLVEAARRLRARGYRLKLHDCYRPRSVQWELWKVMPVPGYVADPRKGSNHNRGGAVDLTLVTLDGEPVEMPSAYDFFGPAAHHGFRGASPAAMRHRELLLAAMESAGFRRNPMEWWHYDLPEAMKAPLRDEPFSVPTAPDAGLAR